ncbi:DNA alkylation repair protein [Cupriavidus sp. CV2]|uniref:DNA alkylation repair protein n=1 Tax=Cupriavidus ulmosensis TaxID=3065913 RepID=UPI00296AA60F|nr:DNA alkylation repair protein [Cupriavidus sp. CV2]MDW3688956.1 DNA alkylation repair protein [Cupriavidus sp. CV2]
MSQSAAQPATRKGASRAADIPPDILAALERGEQQSATLTECLALNQVTLLRAVFPKLPPNAIQQAEAASQLGILKRMASIGAILTEQLGAAGIAHCQAHPSDTVRGWACLMAGMQPGLDLNQRLAAIRPLADDPHFGVREWAWMAVRPHLAVDLDTSIALLVAWTPAPSERLRRFATEALRPRGVWCAHIATLKKNPAQALPILEALKADPSAYVQDSVANWLNDAAKDSPDWVRALCQRWQQDEPAAATRRICNRALRNL